VFRVRLRPDAPAATAGDDTAAPIPEAPHAAVIACLSSQPEPLFALLDAARDDRVLGHLVGSGVHYQTLYAGVPAERFMKFAPYLAALPVGCELLPPLVREGWGASWGVYLTSGRPFAEVRKHLRRFLTAELEAGKPVLFRFYDPRVLRVFLPTCTPNESQEFFGPVTSYVVEGDGGAAILEYRRDSAGVGPTTRPLDRAAG
jgi:hypothetical protein